MITREELYRAVWKTSARQLAKQYGISDVALGKLCRRLQVPRPAVGYWARKANGQPLRRPLLRKLPGFESVEITPTPPRPELPAEVKGLLLSLEADAPSIPLATSLGAASPLIKRLRKEAGGLSSYDHDNFGRVRVAGILVTPPQVDRALLILDALLRILQPAGCRPRGRGRPPRTGRYDTHSVGLRLRTPQGDVRVQIVEEASYIPPAKKGGFYGNHFRKPAPIHSGQLGLRVHGPGSTVTVASCSVKAGARLEDKLTEAAATVLTAAVKIRFEEGRWRQEETRREEQWARVEAQRRVERERAEAERREMEATRREEERRRQEEEARRKALEDAAERWTKCQQMRAYLAAYEAKLEADGRLGTDDEAARWLVWATAYVESQDPLVGS